MESRGPTGALLTPPLDANERRTAFEREALVHVDVVYRAALRLAGNAADADDLVQTALLNAYRSWHQYRPGTNAKAWLLTILRHAFVNEYRRRTARRETVTVTVSDRPGPDPEAAFFDGLVDEEVARAIAALPARYREVLVLTDLDGLRYEESSRALGVPVGTVKSRLFRARGILKAQLRRYAADTGWIADRVVGAR